MSNSEKNVVIRKMLTHINKAVLGTTGKEIVLLLCNKGRICNLGV